MKWIFEKGKAVLSKENLWSGLFPAVIGIIAVLIGLKITTEQLILQQEELNMLREPIVMIESRLGTLDTGESRFSYGISVVNIGNATAKNIDIHFRMFLVSDSNVYSYGFDPNIRAHFSDTTRTPRESLWPALSLEPDSRRDLRELIKRLLRYPFSYDLRSENSIAELVKVSNIFKGEFVLSAEYSYRRESDYLLFVDTVYFYFDRFFGPDSRLNRITGGTKIIDRIKDYIINGPEQAIIISKDAYEIKQNNLLQRKLETLISIQR